MTVPFLFNLYIRILWLIAFFNPRTKRVKKWTFFIHLVPSVIWTKCVRKWTFFNMNKVCEKINLFYSPGTQCYMHNAYSSITQTCVFLCLHLKTCNLRPEFRPELREYYNGSITQSQFYGLANVLPSSDQNTCKTIHRKGRKVFTNFLPDCLLLKNPISFIVENYGWKSWFLVLIYISINFIS